MMGIVFTVDAVVSRAPRLMERPAGRWTHSMELTALTGVRNGAPYSENVYVLLTEEQAETAGLLGDGEFRAIVTADAMWTYATLDLSGQPRSGIACTARLVTFYEGLVR